MPRLKELEGKYAENATFVAMNVWELDPRRIPGFMESHGVNMPAIVALDSIPDGREVNEGFTASGFLGLSEEIMIPKSFIVDQKGLIAWVGHPDFLEGPLAAVIEGSWDAEAFAKELGSETANKAVSSGADSRFAPTTLR